MEEKKLLRSLIILSTIFVNFALPSVANDDYREWAAEFAATHRAKTLESFQQKAEKEASLKDLLKSGPMLQIFVSSSMSKSLLKSLAIQAKKYNGVLVFNGLPEGSFERLTDLVMEISSSKDNAAMQIDDEAFRLFNIKVVPTIVLSMPDSILQQQSEQGNFDKVSGNITVKGALELFKAEGDMSKYAKELLR